MNLATTTEQAITTPDVSGLVADWLAQKAPTTRRAYAADVAQFGRVAELIGGDARNAAHLAITYRAEMLARGVSPATVNRALSALRSVVDLARAFGMLDWRLEVASVAARSYRDTRGPARDAVVAMLATCGTRDAAILKMLYGMALRRSEVVGLDIGHVDLERGVAHIKGKGFSDRAPVTIPSPVMAALRAWLAVHPDPSPSSPLFTSEDNRTRGARLSDRSVARVVEAACEAAGERRVSPHALRHSAITAALDATNGDVRAVARFSRHAKLETVMVYDDNRRDGGGAIAEMVAI